MARTNAGDVLSRINDQIDPRALAQTPNSFMEGAKDTASMWVHDVKNGKVYQVHVTEMNFTEAELERVLAGRPL